MAKVPDGSVRFGVHKGGRVSCLWMNKQTHEVLQQAAAEQGAKLSSLVYRASQQTPEDGKRGSWARRVRETVAGWLGVTLPERQEPVWPLTNAKVNGSEYYIVHIPKAAGAPPATKDGTSVSLTMTEHIILRSVAIRQKRGELNELFREVARTLPPAPRMKRSQALREAVAAELGITLPPRR